MVNINSMYFGFVPVQGTTDTIAIFWEMQEKHATVL
jgi:hypothetical protein